MKERGLLCLQSDITPGLVEIAPISCIASVRLRCRPSREYKRRVPTPTLRRQTRTRVRPRHRCGSTFLQKINPPRMKCGQRFRHFAWFLKDL